MLPLPSEFVIFDTEFTSWEGAQARDWSGQNEYKELVQIGAVKVRNFEEIDSLSLLVAPTFNPELSDYFMDLTGIMQSESDAGVAFLDAYHAFMVWKGDSLAYSYGGDEAIFSINHELYKTSEVVPVEEFNNVRDNFDAVGVDSSQYMSSTIPKAFGLVPPSSPHDAVNDARSILMALKYVYTDG